MARLKIKECDSQIASIVKEQKKIQNKISDANLEKKRLENEVISYKQLGEVLDSDSKFLLLISICFLLGCR